MNKQIKLYDWLDYWMEMYHLPAVSSRTYEGNRYCIKMVKNHMQNQELGDIAPIEWHP